MALPFSLTENYKLVDASLGCVTTNGGVICDHISMKTAHKVWIVCMFDNAVGAASTVQPMRATDVAGTGSVAITGARPVWENEATQTNDILVRAADATIVTTDAVISSKMVVFDIDPSETTGTGGETFDCLGCVIGGAADATNFVSVLYIIETRYPQALPPSAIID